MVRVSTLVGRKMKIFISWSGETSRTVALALRQWLPFVIQAVKPFLSSIDIYKGGRWGDILSKELEGTEFGVICVTRFNLASAWLNFEAGALSKSVDRAVLSPFLFQVKPEEVTGPLAQFQTTTCEKEDVFNLLHSINDKLEAEIKLDLELLRQTFEVWWPRLDSILKDIAATQVEEVSTGYRWLYHASELASIQLHTACRSIWIVTTRFRHALQTTCLADVVKANIKRNVEYTFIYPQDGGEAGAGEEGTLHLARASLFQIFKDLSAEQLKHEVALPPIEFTKLAATNFLMLNPEKDNDQFPQRVFVELPVDDTSVYWMEVSSEAAYSFVERFTSRPKDPAPEQPRQG